MGRRAATPDVDVTKLQEALLAWYDGAKRELPWRDVVDPYAVWVSEIMLQQTRVETVIPYFLRWMERFPTVAALAAADPDDVMRLWSGLGYYSRARNLQRAAQMVTEAHGGRFPTDQAALARLPGIGAYTSGAIASIAFGEAVPAVDGNVLRVLARLFGRDDDITMAATRRRFEALAATLVPPSRPGDWNQALMELGAILCTPRAPSCDACPAATHCLALHNDRVDTLPVRRAKRPPTSQRMHFAWVQARDEVLLVRGATGGLLDGLWGLPGGPTDRPLHELVHEQSGHQVRPGAALGKTQHRFTHRLWHMTIHEAALLSDDAAARSADVRWVPLAALREEALSTAHRKAVALVQERLQPQPTGGSSPQDGLLHRPAH